MQWIEMKKYKNKYKNDWEIKVQASNLRMNGHKTRCSRGDRGLIYLVTWSSLQGIPGCEMGRETPHLNQGGPSFTKGEHWSSVGDQYLPPQLLPSCHTRRRTEWKVSRPRPAPRHSLAPPPPPTPSMSLGGAASILTLFPYSTLSPQRAVLNWFFFFFFFE